MKIARVYADAFIKRNKQLIQYSEIVKRELGAVHKSHHGKTTDIKSEKYLFATSGAHAHRSLEGVINPPLEAGEGT